MLWSKGQVCFLSSITKKMSPSRAKQSHVFSPLWKTCVLQTWCSSAVKQIHSVCYIQLDSASWRTKETHANITFILLSLLCIIKLCPPILCLLLQAVSLQVWWKLRPFTVLNRQLKNLHFHLPACEIIAIIVGKAKRKPLNMAHAASQEKTQIIITSGRKW